MGEDEVRFVFIFVPFSAPIFVPLTDLPSPISPAIIDASELTVPWPEAEGALEQSCSWALIQAE